MATRKTKSRSSGNGNTDVLDSQKSRSRKKSSKLSNNGVNGHDADYTNYIDSRELLRVLTEVKNGNFSARMPIDQIGLNGKVCDVLNEIITTNERQMQEFTKARNAIGKQGKLNKRIEVVNARGEWANGIEALNNLISDLVHPTIQIANVISSVAKGNLSQEMSQEVGGHPLQGEFARIAKEVNDMVKQLNTFSVEVTRFAREVGSEGKLGGKAKVKGVAGR